MRELLFQALASAADGAFVTDGDQRIIFWNRAAESLLGHTGDDILAHACHEMLEGQNGQGNQICSKYCSVAVTARNGGQVSSFDMSVRTRFGRTRWINMSVFPFPGNGADGAPLVVHLFRNVTKRKKDEQLLQEILAAAQGLRDGHPLQQLSRAPGDNIDLELTERELEVLSLLAHGFSTGEVAQALCISTSTVRNHVRSILGKLQVHSRLEAVVHALKNGLIAFE